MRRCLVTLAIVMVASLLAAMPTTAPAEQPSAILVRGDPALTRLMLDRYVRFIEWLYDLTFTPDERLTLERFVIRQWKNGDRDQIRSRLQILAAQEQLQQLYPTGPEQAIVREVMLTPVLQQTRELARTSLELQWLVELHDRAHKPLCESQPALTQRALEARVDMLTFLMRETGILPTDIDDGIRQNIGRSILARYAGLSASQRACIASSPRQWAAIQYVWQQANELEREQYRREWTAAALQSLSEPQRHTLAILRQVSRVMAGLDQSPAAKQVTTVADRLQIILKSLTGDEPHIRSLRHQLTQMEASLRRALALDADELAPKPPMSAEEWSACQRLPEPLRRRHRLQALLRPIAQAYRNAVQTHCDSMTDLLWFTAFTKTTAPLPGPS